MSRNLHDLTPFMEERANRFITNCLREGIDILITSTLRTVVEQSILYRQGRSLAKIQEKADELATRWGRNDLSKILMGVGPQHNTRIVTYAGPGQSAHNYALAFDFVPTVAGKPIWEDGTTPEEEQMWQTCGRIAAELDVEWAGTWSAGKREYPHIQQNYFGWREMIRTMKFT